MNVHMRIIFQASCVGLLLLTNGCYTSRTALDRDRAQCQRNLQSIMAAVKEYPYDNNGQLPKSLDEALSNIGFGDVEKTARIIRCPGMTRRVTGTDIGSLTGYYYINWSKWFGATNSPPASYPLIYDRSLQNHDGKGVNVISVDGQIWWDESAARLRSFAAEHREYQLPLPN